MEKKNFWLSPYTAMGLVIVVYILKITAKLGAGMMINSPVLIGDGFHNLSDIMEASLVLIGIFIASLPRSQSYPYGRKNVESIFILTIGVALFALCANIFIRSIIGILAIMPEIDGAIRNVLPFLPEHKALIFKREYGPLIAGIMGLSCLASFFVSRYQIKVGKFNGNPSLEADGEETRSDCNIEAAAFIGISSEYLFQAAWIEYILGLIVGVLILRTAIELFQKGWRALLQHSIGQEHEDVLMDIARRTEGVEDIEEIKTFAVGPTAVCQLKLISKARSRKMTILKKVFRERIAAYLESQEFKGQDIWISFKRPDVGYWRTAVAVVQEDNDPAYVAPCIAEATHLWVIEISNQGSRGRITQVKLPDRLKEAVLLIREKRAKKVYVFNGTDEEQRAFADTGIFYANAPILDPNAYYFCM